ncbi:DUF4920 domain-containing protein [Arcticibacter tournemirensis]
MGKILFLTLLLIGATYCSAQTTITPAAPGVSYGNGVEKGESIGLATLTKKLNSDSVYTGRISGKVVEVCKKKGCFMKISDGNGDPVLVRFTGYSFFMPQNIVGKEVIVEGKAKVKETSVKQLRHWAEDAGKSKEEIEKINAPKKDVEIMADGVLVSKG